MREIHRNRPSFAGYALVSNLRCAHRGISRFRVMPQFELVLVGRAPAIKYVAGRGNGEQRWRLRHVASADAPRIRLRILSKVLSFLFATSASMPASTRSQPRIGAGGSAKSTIS